MTEASKTRRLAIIDGKSVVFYRGYYAMPTLSTKDGNTPDGGCNAGPLLWR